MNNIDRYKHYGPLSYSYSGGRTSAFLRKMCLDAWGGRQPDDQRTVFANTGKEREETLEFIEESSKQWGIHIDWVEYCRDESRPVAINNGRNIGQHSWRKVDFKTASRKGEPFEQLIDVYTEFRKRKGDPPILPNAVQRYCTGKLKHRTMEKFLQSLGWDCWDVVVGLRADEPKRVSDLYAQSGYTHDYICPLYDDDITSEYILTWWKTQLFDLKLDQSGYEGNCDFCFLKARHKLHRLAKERPRDIDWWIRQEERTGAEFRKGKKFVELKLLDSVPEENAQFTCFCHD
jgi:3'-phosphoadenosine 5'-phosphosulfate sulfotransferase (PAPS reductase)/FAD synthetase